MHTPPASCPQFRHKILQWKWSSTLLKKIAKNNSKHRNTLSWWYARTVSNCVKPQRCSSSSYTTYACMHCRGANPIYSSTSGLSICCAYIERRSNLNTRPRNCNRLWVMDLHLLLHICNWNSRQSKSFYTNCR